MIKISIKTQNRVLISRLIWSTVISSLILGCSNHEDLKVQNSFQRYLDTSTVDTFDLLIAQTTIFDGSETLKPKRDVLIHDGTIEFIGSVDSLIISIKKTIVADSLDILTPGFIDLHAHGNPLKNPEFVNFLYMGVTTICLGQDGTSPNYDDLTEWITRVEEKQLGPNIALFVGHGTLRLLSNILYKKNPDQADFDQMDSLLVHAMDVGCFGMSTGLEYSPGKFADSTELDRLANIINLKKGIIMSHIRNEDDLELENSLKELIRLGSKCPVHVSHLKSVYGKGNKRGAEILDILEEANQKGFEVTADLYPYLASYTGIGILFPDWAKPPNIYADVVRINRTKLKNYLTTKVESRNGPEATLFGSGKYKGKTLAEVATEENIDFADILINLGPSGASAAYFIMDDSLQSTLIKNPLVAIGSDGSPTMYHPRGYGTHAKVIEEYVVKRKTLALEAALTKMTSLPARILGIKDRGQIIQGAKADLILFNPLKVKANATFEDPYQLADGFNLVIVNGQITLMDGNMEELNGKIIRRTSQ